MLTKMRQKTTSYFECKYCDYFTCKKYDFNKHLSTDKHKMLTNANKSDFYIQKKYECICGDKYSHAPSLSRHRKKCKYLNNSIINEQSQNNPSISSELIVDLMKENKEMKELIMKQNEYLLKQMEEKDMIIKDLIPKVGKTTNNFNIKNFNIFLNEKCKDALSMNDFIKQIEISLPNLLITKDKGLADGISNILIENMNKLSVFERPLHCTDIKRETLYIKNDVWEKDQDKSKIKDAINKISRLQSQRISVWNNANPNFMNNPVEKDEYVQLVKNAMDDIDDKEDKIIKNVCKEIHINEKLIDEQFITNV